MPWYWEQRTPVGWVVAKGYGEPNPKKPEGGSVEIRHKIWLEREVSLDEARAYMQSAP